MLFIQDSALVEADMDTLPQSPGPNKVQDTFSEFTEKDANRTEPDVKRGEDDRVSLGQSETDGDALYDLIKFQQQLRKQRTQVYNLKSFQSIDYHSTV